MVNLNQDETRVSRNLVGISIQVSNTEEKELLVNNPPLRFARKSLILALKDSAIALDERLL